MKPSRLALVTGVSVTMITLGWRVGTTPIPSLIVADEAAGEVGDPIASPSPTGLSPTVAAPVKETTKDAPSQPSKKPDPPPPAGPSGTFVGTAVKTSYGTMQVQIVVSKGKIVDVQPLIIGLGDSESRQINSRAVPTLERRVLAAQSAKVSYVSGASHTSRGYLASVSSAMKKAGI